MENLILKFGTVSEDEDFWTMVPKGTPLRPNGSNKSFGDCATSGVLTLCEAEKKSRSNSHNRHNRSCDKLI